ncbi:MAG: helix-turn-helix transcriptional regulator [Clostridia bacterium]|nr:helix-turn-helix transcriptional regulator [Clostridia bacterium]
MDLKLTGQFIAEQRKLKQLTQNKLAQIIGVSEKTISKWECGNGFPDTSLILPLCNALGISANELLSGRKLSGEEYKPQAEKNLSELARQVKYKDKFLLTLEWVIAGFSVIIMLTTVMLASFCEIELIWRIMLIVFGFACVFVGIVFSLIIEKDAGYYECSKCHHKYIPSFSSILWSSHMGRTRHMKCPKCGQKSWNKKTLTD